MNLNKLSDRYIITNEKDLHNLYEFISPHPNCSSYVFPEVDFESKILVVINVGSGGCAEPSYAIDVEKESSKCAVTLTVSEKGICRMLHQKSFWLLLDRADCGNISINVKEKP